MLLYVTVSCFLLGASSADFKFESVCYGKNLLLPFSYSPPLFDGQLYFTPKNSGSKKLLMDNGEAKDPRLKFFLGSVKFTDLTERDDGGTFSVSSNGRQRNIITLTVRDCSETETIMQYYGDRHSFGIPRQAEFLEFIPLYSADQLKVLWNRTDPQISKGGKGQIKRNAWEIKNLNQADMGHYNFRAKDNTLLSRTLLKVQEHNRVISAKVNEQLRIPYPSGGTQWDVLCTPEGEQPFTLMIGGNLKRYNSWFSDNWSATGRIQLVHDGLVINPVKLTDSGIFEFKDPQGNLAQIVEVEVHYEPVSTFVYVGISVAVIAALILCCCCVRKCCCKKSSSKRNESAPQTAATPAVHFHDLSQPAGPSYTAAPAPNYSYQPLNSLVSREHTNVSLEPSVSNPVNIHVNPPQPEFVLLGGQVVNPAPLLGSDCLSSDPEPRFELKGLRFASALPLSSDSTFCDVYTSDKLNFRISKEGKVLQ